MGKFLCISVILFSKCSCLVCIKCLVDKNWSKNTNKLPSEVYHHIKHSSEGILSQTKMVEKVKLSKYSVARSVVSRLLNSSRSEILISGTDIHPLQSFSLLRGTVYRFSKNLMINRENLMTQTQIG